MLPSATLSSFLDVPNNPSYVPSFWLNYSDIMSFFERMYNTVITSAEISSYYIMQKREQDLANSLYVYPGHHNCPSLNILRKKIQLTLINSHYSVSYSRPYPPNVISVAGMHMKSTTHVDQVKFDFILLFFSY